MNKSINNALNNTNNNNNNTNSIDNNNVNNNAVSSNKSETFTSNSEANLNSIELNASIIVANENNNDNNNLKQINLASSTNSVFILEETFKLNKKNPFKREQNANASRRENTNDLNLPHVKQIESKQLIYSKKINWNYWFTYFNICVLVFPKKEKNFMYDKKTYLKETYLMQVNKKWQDRVSLDAIYFLIFFSLSKIQIL